MHKRIGILGGLSPESTITYYEYITRTYYERFGDYNYPEILIYSVNFQEFVDWQKEGRWDRAADKMVEALAALHRAGADFGVIATNTMHIVFDEVQERSPMPLISIIDATAEAIKRESIRVVGLLGTIFTMSESFYRDGLSKHGIKTLVPNRDDQQYINRVIYGELTVGKILPESRKGFVRIVEDLKSRGGQGVVLGCTEIPLLMREEDCDTRLFNTTTIHAEKALEYAVRK
ncbi:MAG: aspartate/glutamate racemase family protein [Candidatus Bathyarchaeia archaeon]